MHWIPFWQWNKWTPQERGEVAAYFERDNIKWAIDLTDRNELDDEKDHDEYLEEQSIGGRPVKAR